MEECTGFTQEYLQPLSLTQCMQRVITDCRAEGPKQLWEKHQAREADQAGDHPMDFQPQRPHASCYPDSKVLLCSQLSSLTAQSGHGGRRQRKHRVWSYPVHQQWQLTSWLGLGQISSGHNGAGAALRHQEYVPTTHNMKMAALARAHHET